MAAPQRLSRMLRVHACCRRAPGWQLSQHCSKHLKREGASGGARSGWGARICVLAQAAKLLEGAAAAAHRLAQLEVGPIWPAATQVVVACKASRVDCQRHSNMHLVCLLQSGNLPRAHAGQCSIMDGLLMLRLYLAELTLPVGSETLPMRAVCRLSTGSSPAAHPASMRCASEGSYASMHAATEFQTHAAAPMAAQQCCALTWVQNHER